MKKEKDYGFFMNFFLKIWKIMDKDDVLSVPEQLAFDIFKINLQNKNNVFLLGHSNEPGVECKKYIVTKSYIFDKNVNTFIVLNSSANRIIIVNHNYKYDVPMPTKTCRIMDKMFYSKIEEERDEMETEILSNITQSLDIVLTQFKENLEKSILEQPNLEEKTLQ